MTGAASGVVVWFTGPPASGKSTLAGRVRDRLSAAERGACMLDSDVVRRALVPAPDYSETGRDAFYETLARLAAMLARQGLVVLVAATAHRRAYRQRARELAPEFVEVYVDVRPEECAQRDIKGLYERARKGELSGLPGVNVPYEAPESPDVVARGGDDELAVSRVVEAVRARGWRAR